MKALYIYKQLLGDSNPFYLHEKQRYYLYTKEPNLTFYSILLSYQGTQELFIYFNAKQGVEPRTTVHETVMLPLHYFAIPFTIN
jgi:hypothetical protein